MSNDFEAYSVWDECILGLRRKYELSLKSPPGDVRRVAKRLLSSSDPDDRCDAIRLVLGRGVSLSEEELYFILEADKPEDVEHNLQLLEVIAALEMQIYLEERRIEHVLDEQSRQEPLFSSPIKGAKGSR